MPKTSYAQKAHSSAQVYERKIAYRVSANELLIKQIGADRITPGGKLYDRYLKFQIRPNQRREPANPATLRDRIHRFLRHRRFGRPR